VVEQFRQEENMRLTIVAGLMVGMALAFQSAHDAHAMPKAGHAAGAVRVQVTAIVVRGNKC
jgi:hypothetical protein